MKLRAYEKGGVQYWRVDMGMVAGKRVQKQFPTKAAAESFLAAKRTERADGGASVLAFSDSDRLRFSVLSAKLALAGGAITLERAVESFLAGQPKRVKALSEAIAECVVAKRSANRRPRYVEGLETYLQAFARGRESMPVHEIATADVETWFVARGERNGTLASNLGRLSALFSLCVRRGYCPVNPCDAVERVRVEVKPPEVLSVSDCERVLLACVANKPRLLAYVALGLFAGVRPEEMEKLKWADVDLENRRVVIGSDVSKVRRRRITELSENAVAWLKLCPDRSGMLITWKGDRRKKILRALRALRAATAEREFHGPKGWTVLREPVPWCQDILRHTAASHLMARDKDAARVADQLGNSPRVLLTNYRALVTPEETAKFWALTPTVK